ncbi:MAG: hypothetical protein ACK4UJ_07595 [Leptonema sp. (in: bacteria)]
MLNIENLENLIKESKILKSFFEFYHTHPFPNLLILSGPNKIVKKILIFRLMQYHLCLNPTKLTPCKVCKSCILFENNEHPDIIIFPEEKIKIGDAKEPEPYTIRWLQREKLIFKPRVSKLRFVVFLSSELLGNESEVALLKTLEESREDTKFVFFTPSLDLLRETIVSRGIVIPFPFFSFSQMKKILNKEEDFVKILGGSFDGNEEKYYEFYKELKQKVDHALEHPLELLNFEKWLWETASKLQTTEQYYFWEVFGWVFLQKLEKEKKYPLTDHIFQFLTGMRAEQSGLLPYLVSKLFFELGYHLYLKKI